MQNIDQQYQVEKAKSESPEDLIGKFLLRLIQLQNDGNQGLNGLNDRQHDRHGQIIEYLDAGLGQGQNLEKLLENVRKSIDGKEIDLSEVVAVLSKILSSNSALGEAFDRLSSQHPETLSELAKIAELLRQNKPQNKDIVASLDKTAEKIGKLLVELIKETKSLEFPKEMKISGPVEISKPSWWKAFEFSWEPLKELVEKIKAHTFSVKVENQFKFDEKFFKSLPDDVAKKLAKVLEENLPKIRISGGGMGNPFSFDEDGNLKVAGGSSSPIDISTLATEATQQQVKQAIQNITIPAPVGGATEANQLTGLSIIPWLKNILTKIAYPAWFDPTANVIRNQVQSGTITTVTTVTTVTGLTNVDGYQGKLLMINQNISAWANCVRARIS